VATTKEETEMVYTNLQRAKDIKNQLWGLFMEAAGVGNRPPYDVPGSFPLALKQLSTEMDAVVRHIEELEKPKVATK
jgi:hypothetical protein